ncbi:MAG: hypothetical protein QOD80_564 [Verrucomicrobiota bacterium]|jgi:hypothetical protein
MTPIPIDDPTPPPETDIPIRATVYFADTTLVSTHSIQGRFRLVGLHLNEAVNVIVQFPPALANAVFAIQPLDGGSISPNTPTTSAVGGAISFQFQAGNLPGLYRISIIGSGGTSTLSFWVADPANVQANRPVANPSH